MYRKKGLNRRQFLAAAGISILATGMARSAFTSNPDVVIIGAGIAGIAAAHALIAGGRTVMIVEALPRIGGRAYTDRTSVGVLFDRGAAYLSAGDRSELVRMARRFAFTTSDHDPDESLYVGNKRADASTDRNFAKARDDVFETLIHAGEGAEVDVSGLSLLQTFLDLNPWGRTAASFGIVTHDGVDLKDLSIRDWVGRDGAEPFVSVAEGIGTLVQRIADGLPIAVNTPATAIRQSKTGVSVETTQGTLNARAVIVTTSPAVLASGAIRFDPALPAEIMDAAVGLPMAHLEKVALAFAPDASVLKQAREALLIPQITDDKNYYFHVRPHGLPMVVHYAGGSWAKTLTDAGQAWAVSEAKTALTDMLGSNALKGLKATTATRWGADARFLGAFAAAKPGGLGARLNLSKPFSDQIWLAGEALGDRRSQSLDGAWNSGKKAAEAILKRLRRQ